MRRRVSLPCTLSYSVLSFSLFACVLMHDASLVTSHPTTATTTESTGLNEQNPTGSGPYAEDYHGSNTIFLVSTLMSVVGGVFIVFATMALCYRSVVVHKNFSLCLRLVSRPTRQRTTFSASAHNASSIVSVAFADTVVLIILLYLLHFLLTTTLRQTFDFLLSVYFRYVPFCYVYFFSITNAGCALHVNSTDAPEYQIDLYWNHFTFFTFYHYIHRNHISIPVFQYQSKVYFITWFSSIHDQCS